MLCLIFEAFFIEKIKLSNGSSYLIFITKEKLLSLSSEKSYKKGEVLLKIGGYC